MAEAFGGTGSGGGGMGWGSFASSAIGAVGKAYAAYSSSKAEKANLEHQAWLERRQQHALEEQAADRAHVGAEQMFDLRLKQSQMMGSQRARIAAKGGSLVEGSHAMILADTQYISDIEANRLKSNTDKAVWLIRENAMTKGWDADWSKMKAKQVNPMGNALTSLTDSVGKLAPQWYRLTYQGPETARGDNAQSSNRDSFQETGESVSGYYGS